MPNWKKLITSGSAALLSNVTASSYTGSFTGSLFGTSSWAVSSSRAITASYALNSLSSSYALSSSRAITASYALNSLSSSYALSSSRAITASYALSALSSSYALSASRAITASYALSALSSSYALSASWAPSTGGGGGATVTSFLAPANTFGITAWTFPTATAGRARIEFYNFNAPNDVGGGNVDVIWDGTANAQAAGNQTVNINNGGGIGNWAATYGGGQVTLTVDNFDPFTTYTVTLSTITF